MFIMRPSNEANGGQGLHALVPIPSGTEILREPPLLRCPNGHAASSLDEATKLHKECITERFNMLSEERKVRAGREGRRSMATTANRELP